jgi:hypothetical protein
MRGQLSSCLRQSNHPFKFLHFIAARVHLIAELVSKTEPLNYVNTFIHFRNL